MKSGMFSLRRLRWKLTLSYTLVVVLTLLVLELLLAGALLAFLNSELPPRLVAQQLRDEVVPRLEQPLNQSPPDTEAIRRELATFGEGSEVRGAGEARPGTPTDFTVADEGSLFVVDDERRLLVSVPELQEFPEGERFDAGSIPGLPRLIDRALEGEENSGELSTNTPEGRVLTVTPIEDEDGEVAGVLISTLRLPNLTGPLLITIAVSAVFLIVPAVFLGLIFGFLTAWGITRRIQHLARAARAWSGGDFSAKVKDRSRDELGQLTRELNSMAAQLESLIQARGDLATLEARNRFARDLHDSVKQQVFATSLQIATARSLIEKNREAAGEHLEQAGELVRQAQKELNVLIHEMRPAALEDRGLAKALQEYASKWMEGSEIPSEVHVRGEREVPLETEQTIFRVAQEALANVAKHSEAEKVELDLVYTPGAVTLRVADDGRGFDTTVPGGGFGMQSMRERTARLGGHISVESEPGAGTRVTCVVPLGGEFTEKGER